jgi:hypothetical protein
MQYLTIYNTEHIAIISCNQWKVYSMMQEHATFPHPCCSADIPHLAEMW